MNTHTFKPTYLYLTPFSAVCNSGTGISFGINEVLSDLSYLIFAEFFIDGLGSLHVGSCDDVIVNHATKLKLPWVSQSESDKTYAKFRYPPASSDATHTKNGLLYFKNRFQCLTHN